MNRLNKAGMEVRTLQTGASFARLRVRDGDEVCLVDLVADPVPALEDPLQIIVRDISIWVDTAHEILVNKLCALLSRSEIRDLEDVKALVENGADLKKALVDAPRKDSGFSPLTLAWVLRSFQTRVLARAAGIEEQAERLDEFKEELIKRLLQTSAPAESP
jgi:NAD(P)-dependent dehydrogenase (short-subunit alcohol dehydrogenase family)